MLIFACISPHPPIILPNIGSPTDREKVRSTITALESLAPKLAAAKPDIIIISSPHPDWGIEVPLFFLTQGVLSGTPLRLNPIDTSGKKGVVPSLTEFKIQNYQEINNLTMKQWSSETIYPILTTLDSPKQHYEWGKQITHEVPRNLRWAWIASGDMSHVLKKDGPYGFNPAGPKFDRKFIELLKKREAKGILNLDPNFVEEAGECGLRSFCMLLGALEWQARLAGLKPRLAWQPEILSYEGPFGVGYLVANLKILTS